MRGGPCINGLAMWRCSKTSATRWLRANSWARTVGERSLRGRLISRVHTEMPSHMLRAMNSKIGANELAVLHANAGSGILLRPHVPHVPRTILRTVRRATAARLP